MYIYMYVCINKNIYMYVFVCMSDYVSICISYNVVLYPRQRGIRSMQTICE